MASQWLTTSQAARVLGISDRQARRYAARLSSDDRREADTASGSRPAYVRLEAMKVLRAAAKGEQLSVNEVDAAADMKADTRPAQGGHDVRPMTATLEMAAAREGELKEEIRFLRSTIEQHQRSEAELRASLREALRAMPKQLEQGKAPEAAPRPLETPTATATAPDGDLPSDGLNDLDSLIYKLFK